MGNEAEAQEVLQEAYVTVWRKAGRFEPAKASPITWLVVLARNTAVDRLRRRHATLEGLDAAADVADDDPSAFNLLADAEDAARLYQCLETLDDRARAMIRSAFIDGASYPQLAAREGVPLGTMKSWIRRGLQSLRRCLEQ
jgi:RNA polymerase sigma-70 factor (ECF subfamily)